MNKNFYPWRPHPWHGISPGKQPPRFITAYIEITPFDAIKYEIDKETGYLKVDRPQLTSSLPPSLYGFIPRTYCADRVAALTEGKATRGDGDPLDVLVLSERAISRSEVLVPARVIGGLLMIDRGEADDKIVAVLESDPTFAGIQELSQLSSVLVDRFTHYFNTYKLVLGQKHPAEVHSVYGVARAETVIRAALEDYREAFPGGPAT